MSGVRKKRGADPGPLIPESLLLELAAERRNEPKIKRTWRRDDLFEREPPSGAGPSSWDPEGSPPPDSASAREGRPRTRPASGAEEPATARRLALEDDAWDRKRPAHSRALREVAAQRVIARGRAALKEGADVRCRLDRACMFHECCSAARVQAEAVEDPALREKAVDALFERLTSPGADGAPAAITKTANVREVVYWGTCSSFVLCVPEYLCQDCGKTFVPLAIHALAWQSSPVLIRANGKSRGYTRWCDLDLADIFASLRVIGSVSGTAFAAFMEERYRLANEAVKYLGCAGEKDDYPVKDAMLLTVHFAYQRAAYLNKAVGERDERFRVGFGRKCASCATVRDPIDDKLDASCHFDVAMDAAVSLCTNETAAKAARAAGLTGKISDGLGLLSDASAGTRDAGGEPMSAGDGVDGGSAAAVAAVAHALGGSADPAPSAGGALTSGAGRRLEGCDSTTVGVRVGAGDVASSSAAAAAASVPAAVAGRPAGASVGAEPSTSGRSAGSASGGWHNHLHCSLEKLTPAQLAAALVEGAPSMGFCGAVCMHGEPLLFINMKSREHWGMYNRLLRALVLMNRADKIRVAYIDFSCLYQVHFFNEFGVELEELGLDATSFKFFVDWLHMRGHVAACRYSNGAMYNEGTGRRIGVGAETLWSKVRSAPRRQREGHGKHLAGRGPNVL